MPGDHRGGTNFALPRPLNRAAKLRSYRESPYLPVGGAVRGAAGIACRSPAAPGDHRGGTDIAPVPCRRIAQQSCAPTQDRRRGRSSRSAAALLPAFSRGGRWEIQDGFIQRFQKALPV